MLLIKQYMLGLMLLTAMDSCYNMEFPMVDEQDPKTDQAQEQTPESSPQYLTATFAGGCFWGTEYVFQQVPGVKATRVGFMGGRTQNPSYKEICYADTNHAEVVQLVYDPQTISYEKLVKVFFKTHDPTTLNRQGPDVGTQYRSAIFYHNDEQKETAEKVKAAFDASGEFRRPIVTEIAPADTFWKAENYHQDYFKKNPNHPACHIVDIEEVLSED
ncbi:MAG: peptide-methionine (S)-S-oxide reductase MsrA [Planctomycetota bacterium]|jgi:peptide-methionine (S)-S-oxide reductase